MLSLLADVAPPDEGEGVDPAIVILVVAAVAALAVILLVVRSRRGKHPRP